MDFDKEIIDGFVDESDEVLAMVIDDIIAIESKLKVGGPHKTQATVMLEDDAVNRIFRAFHSLKGGGLMLGFERLGEFAHKAENLLSLVRSGGVDVNKTTVDLLLHSVDTMRLILSDIRIGEGDGRNTAAQMHLLDDALELAKQAKATPEKTLSVADQPPSQTAAPEQEKAKGGFALDLGENPEVTPAPVKAAPLAPLSKPEVVAGAAIQKQLRILIVEDDFMSRTVLNTFLSEYGNCDIAKDGEEAIYAFTESYRSDPPQPYDLICMDILMPVVDGLEASQKIRAIEREKRVGGTPRETAIVITSAVQDPATIIRACYECGANYYFLKPLDFNQMKRQMQRLGLIA